MIGWILGVVAALALATQVPASWGGAGLVLCFCLGFFLPLVGLGVEKLVTGDYRR